MDKIGKAIKMIKSGDEEGFECIYNEYKNLVYTIVYSSLKNNEDAEDCMQEIFFKVYSSIEKFDDKISTFKTWLVAITKNCIIDAQRKKTEYDQQIQSHNSEELTGKTVSTDFMYKSNLQNLIGERNYMLLVMRYGFNYSYKELAKEFNESIDQVRYEIKNAEKLVQDLRKNNKI